MLISIIIGFPLESWRCARSVVDNLTMSGSLIGVNAGVLVRGYFDLPFAVNLNGCRLAGESVLMRV